jgi:serine phosphatase RsbU (regulator of sigma subunit)
VILNIDNPIIIPDLSSSFDFSFRVFYQGVIFAIGIFLMVLISFKSSWVNFINKRQKIATFFGGFAIILIMGLVDLMPFLTTNIVSVGIMRFYLIIKNFMIIYIFMSMMSILLHLPTAGLVDKRMKQFNTLARLSESIPILKFDQITNMVAWMASEVSGGNSSWLLLWNKSNNKFHLAALYNLKDRDYELIDMNEASFLNKRIIESKDILFVNEIEHEKDLSLKTKIKGSLIGVPIVADNSIMGILYVLKEEAFGFDRDDADMLKSLANHTLIALENANLLEQSIEKERLKQELKVAREVQLSLLPDQIPDFGENIQVDAVSIPANEVGGDYFDFIKIDDKKIGVIIADVSGKGISAAIYMAEVKGIIQSFRSVTSSPLELLKKVNHTLYENIERKTFVTLIFGIFDVEKCSFDYARAGHMPILYFEGDSQNGTFLQPDGLGLGLDKGKVFNKTIEEQKIELKKGDILILYTDGITETMDPSGEEFGEENLLELVKKHQELEPIKIKTKLIEELEDFSKGEKKVDDITLIIVKSF